MNILLVNPLYPDTYWSFKHALKFISKKAAFPPLGLLTVASQLPENWEKKLVDMNVSPLSDKNIQWADYVFIGAMSVQYNSAMQVIQRVKNMGVKIVCGGPLFTEDPGRFQEVDHLVLNEAEITLPKFIADLMNNSPQHIYQTTDHCDMTRTPMPNYTLIKPSKYASMSIQYSRGCPFNCEFCDITALFGHKVRTKTALQIVQELDALLGAGCKENVFFVDDNFIGNKNKLKQQLLPAIITWMKQHKYPFRFTTEASLNLADDTELMTQMVQAGFIKVFLGIETPNELSLTECNKVQNKQRDLIQSVKLIQSQGLEVSAGFIVGFDNDPPDIFQQLIDFIEQSNVINAMVGLLNAPQKTQLYQRLKKEGRITNNWSGDNTNYSMNFIPKMNKKVLLDGYEKIVRTIYSGNIYSERVKSFLSSYSPPKNSKIKMSIPKLLAFFKSVIIIGVWEKYRMAYWKLLFWSLMRKREVFPLAITYSIYGYHFRRIYQVQKHTPTKV